jgi:hypothetical protein
MVMKLQVPLKVNFLTSRVTISFSRRTPLHGVYFSSVQFSLVFSLVLLLVMVSWHVVKPH